MTPYQPRARRWLGVLEHADWRLKHYAISLDGQWPDSSWQPGQQALLLELPDDAHAGGRTGLGFFIQHRGRGADYQVLAWWDRENELPLRLRIREHGDPRWRTPRGSESVCVWDLQIIAGERDAYVAHMLGARCDREAYLQQACAPV